MSNLFEKERTQVIKSRTEEVVARYAGDYYWDGESYKPIHVRYENVGRGAPATMNRAQAPMYKPSNVYATPRAPGQPPYIVDVQSFSPRTLPCQK